MRNNIDFPGCRTCVGVGGDVVDEVVELVGGGVHVTQSTRGMRGDRAFDLHRFSADRAVIYAVGECIDAVPALVQVGPQWCHVVRSGPRSGDEDDGVGVLGRRHAGGVIPPVELFDGGHAAQVVGGLRRVRCGGLRGTSERWCRRCADQRCGEGACDAGRKGMRE